MGAACRVVVALAGLAVLGAYLRVALPSLSHPFGLEWMEGGTLDVIARAGAGMPIYTAPSVEYVPYLYTPGYYFVGAGATKLFGLDFFGPRLVSLISTLIAAALIGWMVVWEGGRRHWGLLAATVYIASYEACGQWFHLARVDSLYVLSVLAAAAAVRFGKGRAAMYASALLIVIAIVTKQSTLMALAPMGVWLLVTQPRRALTIGAAVTVLLGGVVWAWQWKSDGWFLYYVWTLPSSHALVPSAWLGFWVDDLRLGLPMLALAPGLVWLRASRARAAGFYAALLLGLVGSAWFSRLHSGGALNALMPAFAGLALTTGLCLSAVERRFSTRWPRLIRPALAVLALGQVALLAIPMPRAPSLAEEADRGERFMRYLAARPGETLLPDHRFVQTKAGQPSFGLGMAAADVLRATDGDRANQMLRASLIEAFESQRFAEVILSVRKGLVPRLTREHYCFAEKIDFAPRPVTGARHRPRWVWVRPSDSRCAQ